MLLFFMHNNYYYITNKYKYVKIDIGLKEELWERLMGRKCI